MPTGHPTGHPNQYRHETEQREEEHWSGAHFEAIDSLYAIYDGSGGKVELSAQEALNLLEWHDEQRRQLFRRIYQPKEQGRPQYP